MPRRGIEFLSGCYYHVYNRGINCGPIFFSKDNYLYFLRLLKGSAGLYTVTTVAYCLLPDHFHLLLRPGRDYNLQRFVQSVCGSYVQAVNKQRRRQGPLYQGRFRAIRVDREEYLVHVARYIHANPVTAGSTGMPEMWPYSNYPDLIGLRAGSLKDDTLIPERFATARQYREFVEEYVQLRKGPEELEPYLLDHQDHLPGS